LLALVWIGCGLGVAAVALRKVRFSKAHSPRRQCAHAGIAAFVVFATAAWFVSPVLPGGDEPRYLLITQSLLHDHDLQIENNTRQGDYHEYFAADLGPGFLERGRNGAIYSVHAPGVPALILPAFAIAGYHGVVVFLLIVAAAAASLAWWLAWRVTESSAAAWFGWAAVTLSPPYLLSSFTVYPDGLGAAVVLTGVWALLRTEWEAIDGSERWIPWFLYGAALALLPWMHTRFAILAATLGGLILVRLGRAPAPMAKAVAFLAAPAASAICWLFYFVVIYGTPDPTAPYRRQTLNSLAYLPNGIGGLFLDQGFGLFAAAPVLAVALFGFPRVRRLAIDYATVLVPYLLVIATFAMWWGGWSWPARFLVPLVLPLAIPAACAWKAADNRGLRAVMAATLVFGMWLSVVMAAGNNGRLAFHGRNESGATTAPWADWVGRTVDLASALPAFVPQPIERAAAARQTAARTGSLTAVPWMAGLAAVALIVRRRRWNTIEEITAGATLLFGLAAMACAAIVWHFTGARPLLAASSELSALRTLSSSPAAIVDLTGRRIARQAEYASSMVITVDAAPVRSRGPQPLNAPLAVLPAIPAGDYRLLADARAGDGWVMAGIARDQFSVITEPLRNFEAGVVLRFPVDVRSIVVRSDETAGPAIRRIVLRPLRLVPMSEKLTTAPARRAVRYGAAVAYFLDDHAFAEPAGFWVGGGQTTSVVVAPDGPASSVALSIRNGPTANDVAVANYRWRETLRLAPGEERIVKVPMNSARGAALVEVQSATGFRPVEGDTRFLGVFVRVD
jgi:hypothetical protein